MKVKDTIVLTIVFIMILIFFVIIFSMGAGATRVRTVYNLWGIISYENWQIIQILASFTLCIIIIMKIIN